jgi:hypothetical protein
MRTWERLQLPTLCGNCGALLDIGAPALIITIQSLKRRKIRCAECAGLAPPELPALPERSPSTKPMQPIARAVPRDWKTDQYSDR